MPYILYTAIKLHNVNIKFELLVCLILVMANDHRLDCYHSCRMLFSLYIKHYPAADIGYRAIAVRSNCTMGGNIL